MGGDADGPSCGRVVVSGLVRVFGFCWLAIRGLGVGGDFKVVGVLRSSPSNTWRRGQIGPCAWLTFTDLGRK